MGEHAPIGGDDHHLLSSVSTPTKEVILRYDFSHFSMYRFTNGESSTGAGGIKQRNNQDVEYRFRSLYGQLLSDKHDTRVSAAEKMLERDFVVLNVYSNHAHSFNEYGALREYLQAKSKILPNILFGYLYPFHRDFSEKETGEIFKSDAGDLCNREEFRCEVGPFDAWLQEYSGMHWGNAERLTLSNFEQAADELGEIVLNNMESILDWLSLDQYPVEFGWPLPLTVIWVCSFPEEQICALFFWWFRRAFLQRGGRGLATSQGNDGGEVRGENGWRFRARLVVRALEGFGNWFSDVELHFAKVVPLFQEMASGVFEKQVLLTAEAPIVAHLQQCSVAKSVPQKSISYENSNFRYTSGLVFSGGGRGGRG